MSFLTGKPATSSSSNTNNDLIKSDYGGQIANGTGASNYMSSLLTGQGDTGAAEAGYKNYLQQAGYAPAMKQLSQNITGQGAASGILNSGTTAKALQTQGANLNQQYFNNYLQQLSGLSGQGLQAGGLVAGTGQTSQSTGATGGLLGAATSLFGGGGGTVAGNIGSTISGIFSDRRLKAAIRKVGEFADGLGIYTFRYRGQKQRFKGTMADEVARLRPWALGPEIDGYATVNYGAL